MLHALNRKITNFSVENFSREKHVFINPKKDKYVERFFQDNYVILLIFNYMNYIN